MKVMKNLSNIVIIFLAFIIMTIYLFSFGVEITEIDFASVEFVELVKNSSDVFNESYFTIEDESVGNTNSFSIIKEVNTSDVFLIVGSKFIDTYNISNLNCSIYQTSATQVGYGGMSSKTESFSIQFNEDVYANFSKVQDEEFGENETYHYNSDTSSYIISNMNLCEVSLFNEVPQDSNSSNSNSSNSSDDSNNLDDDVLSSCELNIEVDEIIEGEKISFTHSGNYSLGVEYYIVDGLNETVKSSVTSSTSSTKTYTPKKNGKFTIHSSISQSECNVFDEEDVFFYNTELDVDNEDSSISVNEDTEIEINQVLLKSVDEVELLFTASRGDSSKYRLKVIVNDETRSEFDLKKYSEVEFKYSLTLEPGENEIEISGFGESESVTVEMPDVFLEFKEELIMFIEEGTVIVPKSDIDRGGVVELKSENVEEFSGAQRETEDLKSDVHLKSGVGGYMNIETAQKGLQSVEEIFSKQFFSQNMGVIFIVIGFLLISGVIVALR